MNQTSLKNVKALLCFLQVMLFAGNSFQQLTIETMYMNRLTISDPRSVVSMVGIPLKIALFKSSYIAPN